MSYSRVLSQEGETFQDVCERLSLPYSRGGCFYLLSKAGTSALPVFPLSLAWSDFLFWIHNIVYYIDVSWLAMGHPDTVASGSGRELRRTPLWLIFQGESETHEESRAFSSIYCISSIDNKCLYSRDCEREQGAGPLGRNENDH